MSTLVAQTAMKKKSRKVALKYLISDKWNEILQESDCFSSKLKQATFLFVLGYWEGSLAILCEADQIKEGCSGAAVREGERGGRVTGEGRKGDGKRRRKDGRGRKGEGKGRKGVGDVERGEEEWKKGRRRKERKVRKIPILTPHSS